MNCAILSDFMPVRNNDHKGFISSEDKDTPPLPLSKNGFEKHNSLRQDVNDITLINHSEHMIELGCLCY